MLTSVSLSLRDLAGDDYLDAVVRTTHALTGRPLAELEALASERVEFFPAWFARRNAELTRATGTRIVDPFEDAEEGAPTASYRRAHSMRAAPLGGLGACRVGQDGRVYLTAKSEHYQLSLGHGFPGYRLVDLARELGIPNATHNNTRGHLTRLTERRLVAAANGLTDESEIDALIDSDDPGTLNRVINLETGSLAAEAALKMMLTRFYDAEAARQRQDDVVPVFLVLGDLGGGLAANYHGTTVMAQALRGLWPAFAEKAAASGLFRVVPVPLDDIDGFREVFEACNTGRFKVAGFCHEIVLMNYGGLLLDPEYLRQAYSLCHANDVLVFCDEIQSGAWYEELFLFRRYRIDPDLVAVGKGFPGGMYPASKILATAGADSLSQFGALVTNGQEELASLSYLITMEFARANGDHLRATGDAYHAGLDELTKRYPEVLAAVTGDQHMAGLQFHEASVAAEFCHALEATHCIDISTQAYKPSAPPTALTKLPLISDETTIEVILDSMDAVLAGLAERTAPTAAAAAL